jgi:steroid delta-isomerase-like uncharacterized protein
MSVENNVATVRRWFDEVWNQGNLETVRELMAEDAIAYGLGEHDRTVRGRDEFLAFANRIKTAFPDIHLTVDDAFGAGDKVVVRFSATMTHTGDGLGVPATHKPVRITGICINRLSNGQLVEGWNVWDQAAMMHQIGIYPRHEVKLLESRRVSEAA